MPSPRIGGEIPLIDLAQRSPLEKRIVASWRNFDNDFGGLVRRDGHNISAIVHAKALLPAARQLTKTRSYSEFITLRETKLHQLIDLFDNEGFKSANRRFEDGFFELFLWLQVLNATGVVVAKEWHFFEDVYYDPKNAGDFDETSNQTLLSQTLDVINKPVMANRDPRTKIISDIDRAEKIIGRLKKNGRRVGVTLGVFDFAHKGQRELLRASRKCLGKFGKLVAYVASDEETRFLKGPERPINNAEERVDALASLTYVDYVIAPSGPSERLTLESIRKYYDELLTHLGPHFRMVGRQDEKSVALYERESKRAGVGLLYSGRLSPDSTTEIIERILQNYRRRKRD